MPSERTFVTELSTALGMVGLPTLGDVFAARPPSLSSLGATSWDQLQELFGSGTFEEGFVSGFANGQAFLRAPDALAERVHNGSSGPGGTGFRAMRPFL